MLEKKLVGYVELSEKKNGVSFVVKWHTLKRKKDENKVDLAVFLCWRISFWICVKREEIFGDT